MTDAELEAAINTAYLEMMAAADEAAERAACDRLKAILMQKNQTCTVRYSERVQ